MGMCSFPNHVPQKARSEIILRPRLLLSSYNSVNREFSNSEGLLWFVSRMPDRIRLFAPRAGLILQELSRIAKKRFA
jgi:hypothetical protein